MERPDMATTNERTILAEGWRGEERICQRGSITAAGAE